MKIDEKDLTPARIVEELDRYVVGQKDAKRAVAVAIRNRWRRMQLSKDMRREVVPKNILLMGPTGAGKSHLARRIFALKQRRRQLKGSMAAFAVFDIWFHFIARRAGAFMALISLG